MTAAPESAPTAGPARRRRFPRRLAALAVVVLLGLGLLWIAATGLIARHDADAVRSELSTLKSDLSHGNETGAAQLEARMQHQSGAAHARTTGPAWWLASQIPYLGDPARTVRGATAIVDQLAHVALPSALRAGQLLDPKKVREGPDQINTQLLGEAAAPLGQAVQATDSVLARAQKLPSSTWLGKVNTSRNLLVTDLSKLRRGLADLSTAARLLPGPLGETGTQRYLVAFETDAEARGLGGLPGDFAILQARHGKLSFLRFGSDAEIQGAVTHINLGADYNQEFAKRFAPETSFVNSDVSPNFPYAARIWMSMWENTYHQHLDGALATDPTALSYLLGATGGVTLSDGTVISESNAVSFFENGVYTKFGYNDVARKAYQVEAAKAVTKAVLHEPSGDLLAAATALQRAADQRRLLIYSSDPSIEASLQNEPVGGVIPETTDPFLDVSVNNGAGDKIDYYLNRTVTYRRASCTAPDATVTVVLHNGAPTSGLTPTLAGFEDGHPKLRGYNKLVVSLYSTEHSSVTHVTRDGTPAPLRFAHERGHPVTITHIFFGPGQTRTLVFYLHEPPATAPMIVVRQPGVRPLSQTISEPSCGS
jgi:Protein of unknown function (DUF4012)